MVLSPAATASDESAVTDETAERVEAAATNSATSKPRARRASKAENGGEPAAAATEDGDQPETGTSGEEPEPTIRHIQSAPAEPVDLVGIAGPSLLRRAIPFASIAGALVLLRIVVYALRRRQT
jgi:hypothetical protein